MSLHPATARATRAPKGGPRRVLPIALLLAAGLLATLAAGCGTQLPRPLAADELAAAQTFPYFRTYWVGPSFEGHSLSAADGLNGYIAKIGDSVYYGDCVQTKGIFGGGNCQLPLQVTTVIYHVHSNAPLGPQHNILVRGVPATVYDEGRSIELYTGRVAVDLFSNDYARAIAAAEKLLPLNAPGSDAVDLPPPIYCPGLSGDVEGPLAQTMASLPGHICQRVAAQVAYTDNLRGEPVPEASLKGLRG